MKRNQKYTKLLWLPPVFILHIQSAIDFPWLSLYVSLHFCLLLHILSSSLFRFMVHFNRTVAVNLFSTAYYQECVCSVVSDSTIPRTVTCQAPQSTEFSRQEYWSWLPFPAPGDLPNAVIEHTSLASPSWAGRFFATVPPAKPTTKCACPWSISTKLRAFFPFVNVFTIP